MEFGNTTLEEIVQNMHQCWEQTSGKGGDVMWINFQVLSYTMFSSSNDFKQAVWKFILMDVLGNLHNIHPFLF